MLHLSTVNLNLQRQAITTHNTKRHCRVSFYTFVGKTFSKQLYIVRFAFFTYDLFIVYSQENIISITQQ